MTDHWIELGNALKMRRERLGLTQPELCAAADISLATVQAYERGDSYRKLPRSWKKVAAAVSWAPHVPQEILDTGQVPPDVLMDPARLRAAISSVLSPGGDVDPELVRIVESGLPVDVQIELARGVVARRKRAAESADGQEDGATA